MDESARFCPGCGAPRTAVRERLEREAAATGVPYQELLERERAEYRRSTATTSGWAQVGAPAEAPPKSRRRLWIILAIVGGVLLLVCVGCIVAGAIVYDRFDVTFDETEAGEVARAQLLLGASGRHEERWELLHPAHQSAVPLALFVECGTTRDIDDVDVIAEFEVPVDHTFIGRDIETRFVAMRVEGDGAPDNEFVAMMRHDGEWRWVLMEDDLADYRAGRCLEPGESGNAVPAR